MLYGDAIMGAVEAEAKISPGRSWGPADLPGWTRGHADSFLELLALERRGALPEQLDTYRYV